LGEKETRGGDTGGKKRPVFNLGKEQEKRTAHKRGDWGKGGIMKKHEELKVSRG